YLVGQMISAVRWTVLSRPLGFDMGLSGMTGYYFIGMFFNLFAPGTVGGDLSKIYYLTREGQAARSESWGGATLRDTVSVLADRAVGMCVLVWLGAAERVRSFDTPPAPPGRPRPQSHSPALPVCT